MVVRISAGCSVAATRIVRDDETEGSTPSSPTERSEGGMEQANCLACVRISESERCTSLSEAKGECREMG